MKIQHYVLYVLTPTLWRHQLSLLKSKTDRGFGKQDSRLLHDLFETLESRGLHARLPLVPGFALADATIVRDRLDSLPQRTIGI